MNFKELDDYVESDEYKEGYEAFLKEEERLDAIYDLAYKEAIDIVEGLKSVMMTALYDDIDNLKKEYSTEDDIDAFEEGVRDALNEHQITYKTKTRRSVKGTKR